MCKKNSKYNNYLGIRPWSRHGIVLVMAGLVYIAYGIIYLATEPTTGAVGSPIRLATRWLPLDFWGGIWIFVGILAMISARWPPISKTWGFAWLTGLAAGWSALYWTGVIFLGGSVLQAAGGLVWALMAFLWWVISGLVIPEKKDGQHERCEN